MYKINLRSYLPTYLQDLTNSLLRATDVESRRHLRSTMTNLLVVPTTRCSTIGDRAFLRCRSATNLEQPAVESNVVVVIDYLQAPIEN